MTATLPERIEVHCDNPDDWQWIASQIVKSGHQLHMTPDGIGQLVSMGVPALFSAITTGVIDGLHSMFSDDVIGAAKRFPRYFQGVVPTGVMIHLIGLPDDTGPGAFALRIRLHINTASSATDPVVLQQFWDLSQNQQVMVTQPKCPGCGAPVPMGSVLCHFCGADVRQVSDVSMLVSKLQMY